MGGSQTPKSEGPDSGELVIPGELLDIFDEGNRGRGEDGSHTFDRYHAANPQADTTVRLESVGPGGLYYFPRSRIRYFLVHLARSEPLARR
jgi:hypothetical protein